MRATLASLWGLASMRVGVATASLLSAGLQLSPLTAIHGVESAVAVGLVVPPLVAVVSACIAHRAAGETTNGHRAYIEAVWAGVLLWGIPFIALALAALRVRNCAPVEGIAFMLLGPGAGVALAVVTGLLAGLLVRRRALAVTAALLPPLLGIGLSVHEFLGTPTVFFYGHYFGYFAGSIYDELVRLPAALITLRLVTLSLVAAGVLLLQACTAGGRLLAPRQFNRPRTLAAMGLVAGAATAQAYAPQLGLRASHGYIAQQLGGHYVSRRCELIVPREMQDKARMGRDCDVRVIQTEHFFGLRLPGRVRVYVFRSAAEKRALMGAGQTNIAKPWRREIYLQQDSWPHPVMAHELAHIVVGAAGRGPLRVAGACNGLWPNPGLIEGVAVAADFRGASGLTPHQWARAMLELDRVPPLRSLLGAGFLTAHKRLAYVLTGSFVRHLRDTHGRAVLRAIYMQGDIAGAVGKPLAELEAAWHGHLRTVPLPKTARALAEQRFAGGSVLSAVCPHRIAELRGRLAGDLAAGDDAVAADSCREILTLDPHSTAVRATLVGVLSRLGDPAGGSELQRLQRTEPAPEVAIASARHELADGLFRAGDAAGALRAYRELLDAPQQPEMRRLLQVKATILRGSQRGQQLVADWLAAPPGQRASGAVAVHLARELQAERSDGLGHYLEARQLHYGGEHGRAAALLAQARALGLPTDEIMKEALHMQALCLTLTANAGAPALWRAFAIDATPAQRLLADDFLQRIRIERRLGTAGR